jgi:predicted HicB family RNase H-like nuclease
MKKNKETAMLQTADAFDVNHYLFSVGWSHPDQVYIARVAEFPSLAAHGESLESALQELKALLQDVILDLITHQEPVPEPMGQKNFSGRLNLRMPEQLHRRLAIEAAQQGISLNQMINLKLSVS